MAEKKSFLLRIDKQVLDALQSWAADDLRSLNGQIDFVLRQSLKNAGRDPKGSRPVVKTYEQSESESSFSDDDE